MSLSYIELQRGPGGCKWNFRVESNEKAGTVRQNGKSPQATRLESATEPEAVEKGS